MDCFGQLTELAPFLQVVEFMVPLCCGKCEEKVKEELENEQGQLQDKLLTWYLSVSTS